MLLFLRHAAMQRIPVTAILCLALLPATSRALEATQQEYQAAVRSQPNLQHGEELFHNCVACHGSTGEGRPDGTIPRIAGQHFRVLVKQLVNYRHGTRWDIRMEHVANRDLLANPQAIADVASWVSQLDAQAPPGVGSGDLVAHGGTLYAARCRSCHGKSGEGDAIEAVPRVAGQHYPYLLRQMHDAVENRRPNFSRSHVKLFASFERDDLVGLADFLSRSPWADAAPARIDH
jgi:cytochrome c553